MSDVDATSSRVDLPILAHREDILDALRDHQVIVVAGETGSGKTTQLPQMCLALNLHADVPGLIGHTQPRRIAARSVAARIADELHQPVGHTIGYQVRFHEVSSQHTRVKVMTDGILLAELPRDRDLRRYNTIIIDEAHERSLNIDVLLGYFKRLLRRRSDLRVIVTSATIDPGSFSEHFNGAPIIEVSGRTYPVDIRYRDLRGDDETSARDMIGGILDAVDELRAEASVRHGDILIFLPGERDIRDAARALRGRLGDDIEILPLYARLSIAQQNRVFEQHHQQRIILATNVAETSLTVPNVRSVIDTGLARISRYSARSGVQRLPIEPISKASATQRAGRCGRVAAGICMRLYAEQDFEQREAYTQPELQRTNLAALILQMTSMGLPRPDRFPFIDPPKPAMIRDGWATLHEIGAVDEQNQLTSIGERLSRLPVDPRIGRMLIAAGEEGCLREMLIIAAALSTQDPRDRPGERADAADAAHAQWADESSDFLTDLNLWRAYHEAVRSLTWRKRQRWCEKHFLSFVRMREWQDVHHQLTALAKELRLRFNREPGHADDIHRALLSGLLSRVAVKDEKERGQYLGAGDTRFFIWPGSAVFKQSPKWIIAAEIVETTKRWGRMVAKIDPQWIEPLAIHLVKRTYGEPHWDRPTARVMAYEKVSLYGLPIVERRRVPFEDVDPPAARDIFIREALVEGEYDSHAPFWKHNRALVQEIHDLEARQRRRDLLIDPDAHAALYHARLPADVTGGSALTKWRARAERSTPEVLFFNRDDLLRRSAGLDTERFPDHLITNGQRFELTYTFDPGGQRDGVTVTVPLALLGQLDASRLEWLVPGMLGEKLIALIKTLPKALRVSFVPAPDYAREAAARMTFGSGGLADSLRTALSEMTHVDIPADAFNVDAVDEHMRMNVRVIDESGQPLGQDRDVATLRLALRSKASQHLTEAVEAYVADGLSDWTIGPLPSEVIAQRNGLSLRMYPALVDQQDAAGVRVFDDMVPATVEHQRGLRRLYVLVLGRTLTQLVDLMPDIQQMRLHFASLDDPTPIDEQVRLRVVDDALLFDDPEIRDSETFRRCLESRRSSLGDAARMLNDLCAEILERHHALVLRLDELRAPSIEPALDDIYEHLGSLCSPGFLLDTPRDWLSHFPRYLSAVETRLDKLTSGGGSRDESLRRTIHVAVAQWLRAAETARAQGIVDPTIERHRWLLEEYRVSLFAQQLGTAVPVSPKRLEKHWEKIGPM